MRENQYGKDCNNVSSSGDQRHWKAGVWGEGMSTALAELEQVYGYAPHYLCQECGNLFDEPHIHVMRERIDRDGNTETRFEGVCPLCGGEAFEELELNDDAC